MEHDFESDFYDACSRIDELERILSLAVSLMENGLADDYDVKYLFLTKAESALTTYYQSKLPIKQFLKLNKGKK